MYNQSQAIESENRQNRKMVHHLIQNSEFITSGGNSYYNGKMVRKGRGHVQIGKYCAFGENLRLIAGNNHNYNFAAIQVGFYKSHFPGHKYPGHSKAIGIKIGSDVWIGDNVTILDGAEIGHGCIIAAGAVVPGKKFEDYTIIGGVPGKVIKPRFPSYVREALLKISWWDRSSEWITQNPDLFFNDLSKLARHEFNKIVDSFT